MTDGPAPNMSLGDAQRVLTEVSQNQTANALMLQRLRMWAESNETTAVQILGPEADEARFWAKLATEAASVNGQFTRLLAAIGEMRDRIGEHNK